MAHYPPPNNPQVCRVAMLFQRDLRTYVNVFHIAKSAGAWTLPDMANLALAANNWWAIYYKQCVPIYTSLVQVQVRLYNPANPLAVDYPVTPPVAGTRPGVPEAGNVSLTLSWRTGLAGKAYRGRVYVPGIAQPDVNTADLLVSAAVVLMAGAASAFVSTSFGPSLIPCVFHRPLLVPKPLDNTYTPITTYVIENILDSQRRRLPNRGR